jgi:hypothetical protein
VSELLYDWRFTANQFILATSPLRPKSRIFIFHQNTCVYSPYIISSLTKGWICHLQLLLGLARAVISGPSPEGLVITFYCLKFETPRTWRTRFPYLYPPGTGCPGRHLRQTLRDWKAETSPPKPVCSLWCSCEHGNRPDRYANGIRVALTSESLPTSQKACESKWNLYWRSGKHTLCEVCLCKWTSASL